MDLQQELRDLIRWLDVPIAPSVLDVKHRMRAIYNKLPATIGEQPREEDDEFKFRLQMCENKINDIVKWINGLSRI